MTILAVAVVVGLLVGLMRGGSLLDLDRLRFRHFWLAVAALALQVLLFSGPDAVRAALAPLLGPLYILSMVLLLLALAANLATPGVPVVLLGVALNTLVIAANGGLMPSVIAGADNPAATALRAPTSNIGPMTEQTRLPFLGDVISVGSLPGHAVSLGDVVVALGVAYLLQATLTPRTWLRTR